MRALARSHQQPVPENKTCRLFGAAREQAFYARGDRCQPPSAGVAGKPRSVRWKNRIAMPNVTEHVDASARTLRRSHAIL